MCVLGNKTKENKKKQHSGLSVKVERFRQTFFAFDEKQTERVCERVCERERERERFLPKTSVELEQLGQQHFI